MAAARGGGSCSFPRRLSLWFQDPAAVAGGVMASGEVVCCVQLLAAVPVNLERGGFGGAADGDAGPAGAGTGAIVPPEPCAQRCLDLFLIQRHKYMNPQTTMKKRRCAAGVILYFAGFDRSHTPCCVR